MWLRLSCAALAGLAAALAAPPAATRGTLLVSAAVSLTEALQDCGAAFEHETGVAVTFNFGPSNALARQIAQGAPVDVFVSADERQMDLAERAGALLPGTRVTVAGNRLVVIIPGPVNERWPDPSRLLSPAIRRLAVGDPQAVPAGVYAREWLERADLWGRLKRKIVPESSVRAALAATGKGAADAAIVYRTDALVARGVTIVLEVNGPEAPAIRYPAAVVRQSRAPEDARRFTRFLAGPEGRRLLERRGFAPPPA